MLLYCLATRLLICPSRVRAYVCVSSVRRFALAVNACDHVENQKHSWFLDQLRLLQAPHGAGMEAMRIEVCILCSAAIASACARVCVSVCLCVCLCYVHARLCLCKRLQACVFVSV